MRDTLVDPLAQIFARFEMRDVFAGKRHGFTGLRVAALSRRTEMQREAAEATDFDALTGGQCVAHDLEHLLELKVRGRRKRHHRFLLFELGIRALEVEPLADLAVLAGAKSLKQFKDSALLEPRLFNPASRRGRVVLG